MSDEIISEELAPIGGLKPEDIDKFDGTKVNVARIWSEEREVPWSKDGKDLPVGETRKVMVFKVETEALGVDDLGQPIIHVEEFPLKQLPNGNWQPSGHPKSKSKKFYDKMKINKFSEAVGKEVLIVKKIREMGKNIGTPYLGLSI